MNQVEKPASGYAAPYRGQGTKVTDCVLPTRVQALPKPSHIIQAPWTIEVRLCATHKVQALPKPSHIIQAPWTIEVRLCATHKVQALPKPSHIIQAPWTIEVRLCATHKVQALPKPSHIIQAPWTIEVRLCATHKGTGYTQTPPHHTGSLDYRGKTVCHLQRYGLHPNPPPPTSYRLPGL